MRKPVKYQRARVGGCNLNADVASLQPMGERCERPYMQAEGHGSKQRRNAQVSG